MLYSFFESVLYVHFCVCVLLLLVLVVDTQFAVTYDPYLHDMLQT
jgi:hypothetical protein